MSEPVRTYIGKRIKSARLEKRWSLREMAKEFGTSHSAIRDYERGETRFDVAVLERMADILDKPIAWFIPGWWENGSTLSPDLIRVSRRIEALPDGPAKDRMMNMIQQTLELVEQTVRASDRRKVTASRK
jgi:transcriptional regulator with XRE-family HTH domain